MNSPVLDFDAQRLRQLADRWLVARLAMFGSAARNELRPDSDIDLLVVFLPEAHWTLFDISRMQDELRDLFGRPVDLVEETALRNPFRRRAVLAEARVLYAA